MEDKQPPTIVLTNLVKQYGDVDAVNDVTIRVSKGEVVGFVGPNGAGKTTTISMMMGFIAPSEGSVMLLGRPITVANAYATHDKIGFVAGDMSLPNNLTGQQYITFMGKRTQVNPKRVVELEGLLNPVLDKPLKHLSRGNRQKVALIAAMQHDPELLVLDEPTSGLDPLMQEVFLQAVSSAAKRGTTVFMSSHILSEVADICNRIVFMRSGKFIIDKPTKSLLKQLGKHVTVTSPATRTLVKYLPTYAELLKHNVRELEIIIEPNKLKDFIQWIATKQFDDISMKDRDLDEVFHELYSTKNGFLK